MKKILLIGILAVCLAACSGKEASLFSKAQQLTQKGNFAKAIHLYSQIHLRQNLLRFLSM